MHRSELAAYKKQKMATTQPTAWDLTAFVYGYSATENPIANHLLQRASSSLAYNEDELIERINEHANFVLYASFVSDLEKYMRLHHDAFMHANRRDARNPAQHEFVRRMIQFMDRFTRDTSDISRFMILFPQSIRLHAECLANMVSICIHFHFAYKESEFYSIPIGALHSRHKALDVATTLLEMIDIRFDGLNQRMAELDMVFPEVQETETRLYRDKLFHLAASIGADDLNSVPTDMIEEWKNLNFIPKPRPAPHAVDNDSDEEED